MNSLEKLYALYLQYPAVSTDTRNLIPNSLFFALKGDRFNANAFSASALENGCVYAVVDDPNVVADERYILVDDVTKTLQDLATFHRKQLHIPVVGIAGSNGKTTSKELVNAVLSTQFKTHATQGNLNNFIGVPLTILSTPKDTEILIVEMGANACGEVYDLCQISLPTIGLVTSLGEEHLEGFGTYEAIVETEADLFRAVKENDGLVFVNTLFHELVERSEHQKRITFGLENADFTGELTYNGFFVGLTFKSQNIQTQFVGDYNFGNILAACAIGEHFNVSLENITRGLENYVPANNRSQLVKTEKNTLILDAYNANPSSMDVALQSFAKFENEKKFFVLGDMLELGEQSTVKHQELIALTQTLGLHEGIFVGDIFQTFASETVKTFKNAADARDFLSKQGFENYMFLIKGSRGIRLETAIDVL